MPYKYNAIEGTFDYYQAAGGGTPGGSTNDIQFNNAGAFAGGGPT